MVDGVPLTDNRSPRFRPEIEADDVQSMSIYTAGIPAGYGRKMGGVVELNTMEDSQTTEFVRLQYRGDLYSNGKAFIEAARVCSTVS